MSPARSAYRPFAIVAAVLLSVVTVIPVQAASPGPATPELRDHRTSLAATDR